MTPFCKSQLPPGGAPVTATTQPRASQYPMTDLEGSLLCRSLCTMLDDYLMTVVKVMLAQAKSSI